jgi:2-polyprenyl-3-methyl-5-hydroxy-6-metoxy-1,4-benzoquinol methylase
MTFLLTDNERWYAALTALWAARLPNGADLAHDLARAERDVTVAADVLRLPTGARVLDLACGWGRTTLVLAQRGYAVTGFDLSPELLEIAQRLTSVAGMAVPFYQGTMRALPDLGTFDAVTAFYDDSLLSFEDEADVCAALHGVAGMLRPGGGLLFGTTDCPLILASESRRCWEEASQQLDETIRFDAGARTGVSIRTHRLADGTKSTYHRVRRHYTLGEVAVLLAAAGLRLQRAWNAYDRALPYDPGRPGMVVHATRDTAARG